MTSFLPSWNLGNICSEKMLKINKKRKSYPLPLYLYYSETTLSKEGIKGSKLEVTLEYTRLKPYEVSSRTDVDEFLEKYEKPTEESPGKIDDGESFMCLFLLLSIVVWIFHVNKEIGRLYKTRWPESQLQNLQ